MILKCTVSVVVWDLTVIGQRMTNSRLKGKQSHQDTRYKCTVFSVKKKGLDFAACHITPDIDNVSYHTRQVSYVNIQQFKKPICPPPPVCTLCMQTGNVLSVPFLLSCADRAYCLPLLHCPAEYIHLLGEPWQAFARAIYHCGRT